MNGAADRATRALLDEGRWSEALDRLEAILSGLRHQAANDPATAERDWAAYGRLVNAATAAIHPVVTSISEDPPPPVERATLCWRMQGLLRTHRELPVEAPAWMPVLEGQFVKDGALYWRELIGREPGAEARARGLFERLAQLLDPCPPWVKQAIGELGATATTRRLELVYRPEEPERIEADGRLALNLAALSGGSDPAAAIGQWVAEVASDPGSAACELVEPRESLGTSLAVMTLLDEPIPWEMAGTWAAAAAAWRELGGTGGPLRSADRAAPTPAPDPGGVDLLLELDPVELAVLRGTVFREEAITAAIDRLRQEEARPAFWLTGQRDPGWWMGGFDAVDALRRFVRDRGFYAGHADPAASLRAWSEAALGVLTQICLWGEGALWSADEASHWMAPALVQALSRGSGRLTAIGDSPEATALQRGIGGRDVLYVGVAADAVESQHRSGRALRLFEDQDTPAYGLRCLEPPESRYPHRPHGGFEHSLEHCLSSITALHDDHPFELVVLGGGAYRMPLCLELRRRHGVSCWAFAGGGHQVFGVELPGDRPLPDGAPRTEKWLRLTHQA